MKTFVRVFLSLMIGACIAVAAHGQASVPTLTVEQKKDVQILLQQLEIDRLRLGVMLQSLQKDGFDLDLQTMTYVKKPDPPVKKEGQ